MTKFVPASISQTAFNCPHCGVLAQQEWYEGRAKPLERSARPAVISFSNLSSTSEEFAQRLAQMGGQKTAIQVKKAKGVPFIYGLMETEPTRAVANIWISVCFHCMDASVWVHNRLIYPNSGDVDPPNQDMPNEVRIDYDEAASILHRSPRGAAALLRLCIQKLCKELGEKGEKLDHDIGQLVKKGLSVEVKQALDIVRVTGNESVHPGEMNLRDNVDIASALFSLVNLIADRMIGEPRRQQELLDKLPKGKLDGIATRDKNTVESAAKSTESK